MKKKIARAVFWTGIFIIFIGWAFNIVTMFIAAPFGMSVFFGILFFTIYWAAKNGY